MANSISFHQPTHRFISCPQVKDFRSFPSPRFSHYSSTSPKSKLRPIKAATDIPTFPLLQPPKADESPSELEPADPNFYKIGYVRSMRAYGIEFKEGPGGFGVYPSKDVEPLRRARVIMEIPLELMLTISQKFPWMFFPDVIPVGHPIFDILNSTIQEEELLELQYQNLASTIKDQQRRALRVLEKKLALWCTP